MARLRQGCACWTLGVRETPGRARVRRWGRGTAEQHRCVSLSGSVGAGTKAGCKLELAGSALIWRVGVTLEPVEPVGCRNADIEVLFPSQV